MGAPALPDPSRHRNEHGITGRRMIRPGIFDFEPDLGLNRGQSRPQIPGAVPTDRHTTIPNDSGPISACFDDDPKLLNCKITQPR